MREKGAEGVVVGGYSSEGIMRSFRNCGALP